MVDAICRQAATLNTHTRYLHETILDYALNETGAYVGIGVGQTMRHTNPKFFADVVERYGPDRLMVNSDHVAYVGCDLLAIPKAIRELSTWGVPWSRVRKGDRQVVVNAEKVTITEKEEAHGLYRCPRS